MYVFMSGTHANYLQCTLQQLDMPQANISDVQ
jgi:hypothetical protein